MPYLIDGNNLAHTWRLAENGQVDRSQVASRALAILRSRGSRATLVFDGAVRPGEAASHLGPLRIELAGGDADAWMLTFLRSRGPKAADWIVVTSDKALREKCRALGSRAMACHEFREARSADDESDSKPAVETDVESWLQVFGSTNRVR